MPARDSAAFELLRSFHEHDRGRDPERLLIKYQKMQASALAFFRASAFLYFRGSSLAPVLANSPQVWICGDLHFENFGSYKGANRLSYFDVNDFDEAVRAPVAWDICRLAASVRIGAAGRNWPEKFVTELCVRLVSSYANTLASGKPGWIERRTARGPIRALLRRVAQRKRADLIRERTQVREGRLRLRVDGRYALPAARADQKRVAKMLKGFAGRYQERRCARVLDVARRVAGTGSLGIERYVALTRAKGARERFYLFDIKLGVAPSYQPAPTRPRWRGQAERISELQRHLQAAPPDALGWIADGSRSYVVREMQPRADRLHLDSERLKRKSLLELAEDLGELSAWMHLRGAGRWHAAHVDALTAFAQKQDWQAAVLRHAREAAGRFMRHYAAFTRLDPALMAGLPVRQKA